MSDDDMEAVAGGTAKKTSPEKAKADGRNHVLPSGNHLCICHHENKWARSKTLDGYAYPSGVRITVYLYEDIKCYKCNKQWQSYKIE